MNAQIREEAAEWLVEFRADQADLPTREKFAEWLRESPQHVRAYLELLAVWEDGRLCGAPGRGAAVSELDAESLIALARADNSDNVVALEAPSAERAVARPVAGRPLYRGRRLSQLRPVAAAAAAVSAVVIGIWFVSHRDLVYITEVGEQRSIQLADGSQVELNAASRLRVHFSSDARTVELLVGQALFRVAKNTSRPFVVLSGATRVRAVGTEFDVNRKRSGTTVTVLEGRVAILAPKESGSNAGVSAAVVSPIELAAGEQTTVTVRAKPQLRHANVAAATAWTQKQLNFESTPLPDVAEEFNRFNTRRLVVDPQLTDFHINGTFSAVDPASLARFLLFLRDQPGIEVVGSDTEVLIRKKKG